MRVLTATQISLEGGCEFEFGAIFAHQLHHQLRVGYERCSVLKIPETIQDWQDEHRTARKRAWRAERLGYRFARIAPHEYADDIWEINTSLAERQGRPMSAGYRERPSTTPAESSPCLRHGIHHYGVLSGRRLLAYLWCYRSGQLALVSQILGHGEHLRDDVMYLLMRGTIEAEITEGGFLVYNRHDSGTPGLRFFKERCGFEPLEVEWQL